MGDVQNSWRNGSRESSEWIENGCFGCILRPFNEQWTRIGWYIDNKLGE
jgi:hypothetical protein